MPALTPRWVFTVALAVSASACLDFDQYAEGTGGAGGSTIGGAPEGGAGASAPTCPSDNFVPSTVCVTTAPYSFDGMLLDDWKRSEPGTVGNSCDATCAAITLGGNRLDLRTLQAVEVDQCFASIDVLDSNAQRTFLELIPDDGTTGSPIPPPDRASNIEVAVAGNTVRFEVDKLSIPALTLPEGVVVDHLRIQVRADTVVLEAFEGGQQVACTEQDRPDVLDGEVRAGFGIQGSAGQTATFDNYGVLSN